MLIFVADTEHRIYLWHKADVQTLLRLEGHSNTVNCVHWNPVLTSMLASVSDDWTLRIWAPQGETAVVIGRQSFVMLSTG